MDVTQVSASQAIVLRDRGKASGRAVVRALVAELVELGCWRLVQDGRRTVLLQGPAAVPTRPALRRVDSLIRRTKPIDGMWPEARSVRAVARHAGEVEWGAVNDVLAELVEADLLKVREGLLRKRKHVLTPRGREVDGSAQVQRVRDTPVVLPYFVVDGGAAEGHRLDRLPDSGSSQTFDSDFDGSYDAGGGLSSGGAGGVGGGWTDWGGGGYDGGGGGGSDGGTGP